MSCRTVSRKAMGEPLAGWHCDSLVRMRSLLPALSCKQRQGVRLTGVRGGGGNGIYCGITGSPLNKLCPQLRQGLTGRLRSSYTLPCLAGSTPGFCCIFVLFPPNTGKTCVDAVDWLSLGQVSHLIRRLGQGTFRLTSRLREL